LETISRTFSWQCRVVKIPAGIDVGHIPEAGPFLRSPVRFSLRARIELSLIACVTFSARTELLFTFPVGILINKKLDKSLCKNR
jgi:hypothetical protein